MKENRDKIYEELKGKACMKQKVYRNTLDVVKTFKEYLTEITEDLHSRMEQVDKSVLVELEDKGDFEIRLKLGGDILVFIMHTNVFDFEKNHSIWGTSYLKEDPMRAYCGMISCYNFLSDSFKYNRERDLGYLISRMFVNKENHYFAEGKRRLGFLFNDFPKQEITKEKIGEYIEECILYSLSFDLLTPPYSEVTEVSVYEVNAVSHAGRMKTGKRLGFKFQSNEGPKA